MTSRRRFLQLGGSALAAGAAGALGVTGPGSYYSRGNSPPAERIEKIGLQLYTVRGEMAKSVGKTLDRVARIGFKEVEFAGYFGQSPAQLRAALQGSGLAAPSAHIDIADVRGPQWPRVLEAAREIGHQWLVVAWLDEKDRATQDGYKAIADSMLAASARAADFGITLGYHNHEFEFTPLNGQMGLEILLERTAGSSIVFEMDLYWIISAGQDPLVWFGRWPGRFPLVHVKDAAGAPKYEMRDVGAGTINWKRIFAKSCEAGITHYFVEHDEPKNAFASAAASYTYLTRLTF